MMKSIEWQKKKMQRLFCIGSTMLGAMFSHKTYRFDLRKQLNREEMSILNLKARCC